MRREKVITITALTLAFVIGFKSITFFLQHSFRVAILLLILSFTCLCSAFPDQLIGGGDC